MDTHIHRERKKPAADRSRRKSEKRERKGRERDVSLVRRKLLAGEYTAATDSFRGTSRGLYVLMYSLIGLPFSWVFSLTPPFNPSRSPLRGLYSVRYMLMESWNIWFYSALTLMNTIYIGAKTERKRERVIGHTECIWLLQEYN